MTELQLECLSTKRLAKNLMAEADAKNRDAGLRQFADRVDRVIKRRRIAWAIREKNPRWLVLQGFCGGRSRGQNLNLESMLPQATEDVVFHPEIERDDRNVCRRQRLVMLPRVQLGIAAYEIECPALLVFLVPQKRLLMRDFLHIIHANEDKFLRTLHRFSLGDAFRGNETVQCATHAELLGELPRINALDAGDAVLFEILA